MIVIYTEQEKEIELPTKWSSHSWNSVTVQFWNKHPPFYVCLHGLIDINLSEKNVVQPEMLLY